MVLSEETIDSQDTVEKNKKIKYIYIYYTEETFTLKRHRKFNVKPTANKANTLESTKSSSNGLNNLTRGPDTDDSPRGRCLASKVWANS